jgi:hypothetical protein
MVLLDLKIEKEGNHSVKNKYGSICPTKGTRNRTFCFRLLMRQDILCPIIQGFIVLIILK